MQAISGFQDLHTKKSLQLSQLRRAMDLARQTQLYEEKRRQNIINLSKDKDFFEGRKRDRNIILRFKKKYSLRRKKEERESSFLLRKHRSLKKNIILLAKEYKTTRERNDSSFQREQEQ